MKRIIIAVCMACTLLACDSVEKKAEVKLQAARMAYEQGDYDAAKRLIDSIKLCYPKAFDTRRAGNKLMLQVVLQEQQDTLASLDSLLAIRQAECDELVKHFVLEKDTAYQAIGRYLHPSQVIERNLHRSFLRFQVDEHGQMSMTSIYCGATPVHHVGVKVMAPDGSFAETPDSKDSYETTDLGEHIEKADYKLGEEGNVIGFICLNKDRNLRVAYRGERPYVTQMLPTDRQAAVEVYELSQVLSTISAIQKGREDANLKIAFIRAKIDNDARKQ